MRTNRFVIWWGLLVLASVSVGAAAILFLRKEGDEMRANIEQADLLAREAHARARLYHEMAKHSRDMAEYAEQTVTASLGTRARTIADNMDLYMSELKEGLLEGLGSLPGILPDKELATWSTDKAWVADAFLWSSAQGVSMAKEAQATPPEKYLRNERGWLWGKPNVLPLSGKQSNDSSSNTFASGNVAGAELSKDRTATTTVPLSLREENEIAQQAVDLDDAAKVKEVTETLPNADKDKKPGQEDLSFEQNRVTQRAALDGFNQELLNSQVVLTEQKKTDKRQDEQIRQAYALQEVQLGQAESYLSQAPSNARRNVSPSSYWSDSFRAIKLNRKQLRDETRLSPYADANQEAEANENKDSNTQSGLNSGWEYRNDDEYSWVAWRRSASNTAFGVRLDDEEVVNRLRSAFPEHLEEGEHFALLDEKENFVCSAGEKPPKEARLSEVTVPVGEELPGWSLSASMVLPPAVFDAPEELPAEADLPIVFALGGTPSGEWGGYVAISSVMAAILVAALLLGGSVLLLQVRRNSLEAVRKTTFVSNVSHELKTPLTTIRMYGEMLGDGLVKNEKKRKGYLDTIIAESQRLTRLVNNVLDFGRLERGEKIYNLRETTIGSAVEEVLETQRLRLKEAGLEVDWTDDSEGASVKLDSDSLEQVLLNLLDNLVKYAATGEYVGVAVSADAADACLEVFDHGPGIPADHRERIFETFHRVDESLIANKPGCGIGLGIARKLVEDMGGRIVCEANSPKGAKFRITFPRSG